MPAITRRLACTALAATAAGLSLRSFAQSEAPRRYAVVSLIGDEIELVYANSEMGAATERSRRRPLPDAEAAFDKIALLSTGQTIEKSRAGVQASLLALPPSALHRDPRRVIQAGTVGLPSTVVDAVNQAGATHVLLLTKHGAPPSFGFAHNADSVGPLWGLGYYIDPLTALRSDVSGAVTVGFIAPFVYIRLTLANARDGRVLAQRSITATHAYAIANATTTGADPWDLLAPQQKVEHLRALLQTELAREVPLLMEGQ